MGHDPQSHQDVNLSPVHDAALTPVCLLVLVLVLVCPPSVVWVERLKVRGQRFGADLMLSEAVQFTTRFRTWDSSRGDRVDQIFFSSLSIFNVIKL